MQTQPVPSKTLLTWRCEYSELPGSFLRTGDLALVSQLPEADTADAVVPQVSVGAGAQVAGGVAGGGGGGGEGGGGVCGVRTAR